MRLACRFLLLCTALSIALLTIQGCANVNQELAWSGTWRLNLSRSHAYGPYVTIAIAPDGLVTLTNETTSFNFRCDNTEFRNGSAHTSACTAVSSTEWKLKHRMYGKDAGTDIWDISPDGQTWTIRSQSDRAQPSNEVIFARRAGTNGFAGRWQDTTPLLVRPRILRIVLNGWHLHLTYPTSGQYSDSPLYGSASPVQGPLVMPGVTLSVWAISARGFYTRSAISGRVIRDGTMDVSDDDRTLVVKSWRPNDPQQKDQLVYDKQH